MHPRSFDSCNAGWINKDAAAKSGLGHERSGTMHMPYPDHPQTHSTLHRRRRRSAAISPSTAICVLLAGSISTVMAQGCIPLADSNACRAFGVASISTDSAVAGLFPFLYSVDSVASFDSGIASYIAGGFTEQRYQQLIGCDNVQPGNTTDFYARYTTSVLCNAIVQNSIDACGLTGEATRPLCANDCADYALSEQKITASNVCGTAGTNAMTQIRADFTNCALPAMSITGDCIQAVDNQPNDCGYDNNLGGLCSYCAASSPNATDSCCVFSNTTTRCEGVVLPIVATASLQPIVTFTLTASGSADTSTAGPTVASSEHKKGLSGGAIAGIVIGSIIGAIFLLALIIGACLLFRRRSSRSPATSVFNQPVGRQQPDMEFHDGSRDQHEGQAGVLSVLGVGRVARMSALEGTSSSERAAYGLGGYQETSEENTPDSRLAPPTKRSGSVSSGSQRMGMGAHINTSPSSAGEFTSPESRGQSEQLDFFKDYYSQDEIRPSDLVSTLWAYEPRAGDEFQLERGDMIKVLGIWDDGWATGVRVKQRAEDWRDESKIQRDSGVSSGRRSRPTTSDEGEVKAFPLVCVCLPQHWRKTIDGDSTEGSGPGAFPDRGA
ncbi:related to SH3 domain protein [Ramularia collo-cygni]|uniref:Related to SH3 domain protein n=1 Tax=Ramularia collo-cygni TaxID=112498 RepID=A0A2D3USN0_9PEZI|nr:related to SH3 domain protein [Ramularia collo-cygni]CZT14687.1 related to SH3 domain protein [Ramularia collo-cygni]